MLFKNLMAWRLDPKSGINADMLEEQLARQRFHPCGAMEMFSHGWVPPTGNEPLLAYSRDGSYLICLCTEQRLLPADVVRQEADARAIKIAAEQGYKPGRQQMRELREAITAEFLPRSFTRRRHSYVWIDPTAGWIGVDAPSRTAAENVLGVLRRSLDILPLSFIRTNITPSQGMANWLAEGEASAAFTIDDDCVLLSITAERARVRYTRMPLDCDEVREHLRIGRLPKQLALTFDDRLSFVLTEMLEIKRIHYFDELKEMYLTDEVREDAATLFGVEFRMMCIQFKWLLRDLTAALGGEMNA